MDLLRESFEQQADAERSRQMSDYMKGRFPFYGLPTPLRREIYSEFIKGERKLGRTIDWELLNACWQQPEREWHYFVIDYLKGMSHQLTYDYLPALEHFARSQQWWDTIDALDTLIGNIGLSDPRIAPLMRQWATDPDLWIRRIAIDHQRGRRLSTDTVLLSYAICANTGSREFFINKAIGWSLREYAKSNPEWVLAFVDEHRHQLSSLSIREATKHLR